MSFTSSTYANLVTETSSAQKRLFAQYAGDRNDFDVVIIGSGVGGGVLADALADHPGTRRILVLEAGSFVYPTHVYNVCRFPNANVAKHFGCRTFRQTDDENAEFFIGERPQLNFGGRSVFWSGLIPTAQDWELHFFPDEVREALRNGLLTGAGATMNESHSMGATAAAVVEQLRQSTLAADFVIQETPRALHQPYLSATGTPLTEFSTVPTGVFNTAELLLNQSGLVPDSGTTDPDAAGLHLLLNHYVDDLRDVGHGYEVVCVETSSGTSRTFTAPTVVLAGGSLESPKLLRRAGIFAELPGSVQALVGRGLTDHPTTNETTALVTSIGPVPIPKSTSAKIIFYSRGLPGAGSDLVRYPFNVEMNINHEYWHLRENDPDEMLRSDPAAFSMRTPDGPSMVDIKFSFGNCLDDGNTIGAAPGDYVPEIRFHNQKWMDHLKDSRFPAVAGWQKSYGEIFGVLNEVTNEIISQFTIDGVPARPQGESWYGANGKGFGYGTVHHAVGTLRMPNRATRESDFGDSVVDTDLQVVGKKNLYVCDMSVMPISTAANPVRSLVALALRLSGHLGANPG